MNEEVIYFIASVVILLNVHIGKQRYYVGHGSEVISSAVSNQNGILIATGELAAIPEIHIWNRMTLESV